MSDPNGEPVDPEAARFMSKVRWLMAISGATTLIAITAVLGVIGYRVFKSGESGAVADATAVLPKGARVIATAATEDRIVVTVEIAGAVEIRTFDAKTFRPLGRLKFATEP
jgi:hypothetical protein